MKCCTMCWSCLIVAGLFLASSAIAQADCGRLIIYVNPTPRHAPPPPPPLFSVPPELPPGWREIRPMMPLPNVFRGQEQAQRQAQEQVAHSTNTINNTVSVNVGEQRRDRIPLPPAFAGDSVPFGDLADRAFEEGRQQAIVAWNGRTDHNGEEVLILTTNEKSGTGAPGAMLSILPLPGEPISIVRANAAVFANCKMLLNEKWREAAEGHGQSFGVFMSMKIGSDNIFVWEVESIDRFKTDVSSYVAQTYDGNAEALFTNKAIETVKGYFDRGFRFFAFDITLLHGQAATKEAIAYRFKSPYAYYPLAISRVGGTGDTVVDLVLMTPGRVVTKGLTDKDMVTEGPKGAVQFSLAEIESLHPALADVFRKQGLNTVMARNKLIPGLLDGFTVVFVAYPAP